MINLKMNQKKIFYYYNLKIEKKINNSISNNINIEGTKWYY